MKVKKLIFSFLLLIFAFSLVIGILLAISTQVSAVKCPGGICHLVYDPVDNFFYCLGSPSNCCCD
ncbi:MAG: hypothetical protein AB1410_08390 [Acidobacteriota bacterium]